MCGCSVCKQERRKKKQEGKKRVRKLLLRECKVHGNYRIKTNLQIAVEHTQGVSMRDDLNDLHHDLRSVLLTIEFTLALNGGPHVSVLAQLHDKVEVCVRFVMIEKGHDVRVSL